MGLGATALSARVVIGLLTALASSAGTPASARHDIHSTLTVARLERGALELRVRAFADDLSAAVAVHAGRAAPPDSSVRAAEVDTYFAAKLRVWDRTGVTMVLERCGLERTGELYVLCYRTSPTARVRPGRLLNLLLAELHEDQVNVVQFAEGARRRSLLFTRASPPGEIPHGG